jgi:hypothetical protein
MPELATDSNAHGTTELMFRRAITVLCVRRSKVDGTGCSAQTCS